MNSNHAEAALWGALCADAYALGAHWVYDSGTIASSALDWEGFNVPLAAYHRPKTAGDQTHYGDQMLWLLASIVREHDFDEDSYARFWQQKMQAYGGYIDAASRLMLQRLEGAKRGSGSHDLAGAAGFAPLLLRYGSDLKRLVESVEEHSCLTHANDEVTRGALFLAETAYHLLDGAPMEETLRQVACEYDHEIVERVNAGIDSRFRSTEDAIAYFGKSCGIGGFAGVIHLLVRYGDDYRGAMEANVRAGGDSAARGLAVGTLLGARLGPEAVPRHWREALHAKDEIQKGIDAIRSGND